MPPDLALPRCTSATITLANLDVQLDGLKDGYDRTAHVSYGIRLIHGLLGRYAVTGKHTDLVLAESLAGTLVARNPVAPDGWLAAADVDMVLHRFAQAEQALARASAQGAASELVREGHADLLEAWGDIAAALELRTTCHAIATSATGLSRIACCQLALGAQAAAQTAFGTALDTYRGASPLPLCSMLFNWGHTWQHQADYQRAEQAYQAVLRYLPGHLGACRALAACALASGDHAAAVSAARRAARLNPHDPISRGLLGISGRQAGLDGYQSHLAAAHRLFQHRMTEHPEAWAAHAAEYWLAEGDHPAHAVHAVQVNASARRRPGTAPFRSSAPHLLSALLSAAIS